MHPGSCCSLPGCSRLAPSGLPATGERRGQRELPAPRCTPAVLPWQGARPASGLPLIACGHHLHLGTLVLREMLHPCPQSHPCPPPCPHPQPHPHSHSHFQPHLNTDPTPQSPGDTFSKQREERDERLITAWKSNHLLREK